MNRVSITGTIDRVQVQTNRYDKAKTEGSVAWVIPSDNSIGHVALPVWVSQELRLEGLDGLEQKQVATIEGHLTQMYLNNQFLFCVELENIHIHKPYREGKAITEKFQQHKRSRDYAARNASALQREAQEAKQEKAQLGYRVAQLEQELSTKDERLRKEILRVTTGLTD